MTLITSAIIFPSCQKLVTVDPPVNLLTQDEVFINDKSATSTLAGLYSSMLQSSLYFANSAMTVFPAMSADELYNTDAGTNTEFSKNAITISNSTLNNNIWRPAYNFIYQANAIIEGVEKSTGISPAIKKQLLGEAKFIRAFAHFYLVNLYGSIPLITTTAFEINNSLARTPVDSIYQQIIIDLDAAQAMLDPNVTSGKATKLSKWAAVSFLARVYLYRKDYAQAESLASQVINAGLYQLEPDLSKVFLASSRESIWQLANSTGTINTYEGNIFIPAANTIPRFAATSFLLNSFETGDQRKNYWLSTTTISGISYTYPFKYKIKTSATITENYTMLRLAELFLMRAEARAQLNNLVGALSDINRIRNRAGLSSISPVTITATLLAIERERQVELFAEWGHRWFDLKRTERADVTLGIEKAPNWQPTDALYPIPASQIIANNQLTQNPGY